MLAPAVASALPAVWRGGLTRCLTQGNLLRAPPNTDRFSVAEHEKFTFASLFQQENKPLGKHARIFCRAPVSTATLKSLLASAPLIISRKLELLGPAAHAAARRASFARDPHTWTLPLDDHAACSRLLALIPHHGPVTHVELASSTQAAALECNVAAEVGSSNGQMQLPHVQAPGVTTWAAAQRAMVAPGASQRYAAATCAKLLHLPHLDTISLLSTVMARCRP